MRDASGGAPAEPEPSARQSGATPEAGPDPVTARSAAHQAAAPQALADEIDAHPALADEVDAHPAVARRLVDALRDADLLAAAETLDVRVGDEAPPEPTVGVTQVRLDRPEVARSDAAPEGPRVRPRSGAPRPPDVHVHIGRVEIVRGPPPAGGPPTPPASEPPVSPAPTPSPATPPARSPLVAVDHADYLARRRGRR
ncbi:hypothetical protein [Actinomycetospora flava]|uniref:Uncharacterized protein n=1 Tax=Actinomycetospora flava TaxID=3129232 RepID=A0ABU8M811_9PSEU